MAFLGGINISDVYAGSSSPQVAEVPFHQRPWRDTQIRVEGPAVNDLQKIFVALWEREKKEKISEPGLLPDQPAVGPHVVRALEGVADQPKMFQADRLHPSAEAHPIILANIWPKFKPLVKAQ